jgi:hypothetical protein
VYAFLDGRAQIASDPVSGSPILLAVKDSGAIDHAAAMIKQQVSYDGVPLDHGFTVTRRYEPADHSSKIWKDQNGTWHTTYGAQIKAIIKFVPDHETNHAILKEFFPVGLTPNSSSIPEPFYPFCRQQNLTFNTP